MNQAGVSKDLNTGSGPDLDIIQLDNIPDRHLTYRVKGICGGTICMDYGGLWMNFHEDAGCCHYPLSTINVQYSTG